MPDIAKKSGRKGRKIGNHKKHCDRYRAAGSRLKNKIARLIHHLKSFPTDATAKAALRRHGGKGIANATQP